MAAFNHWFTQVLKISQWAFVIGYRSSSTLVPGSRLGCKFEHQRCHFLALLTFGNLFSLTREHSLSYQPDRTCYKSGTLQSPRLALGENPRR